MKAKLIKVLEHYHLYDGDKAIATTIVGNPMLLPNLSLKNCQSIELGYDLENMADFYGAKAKGSLDFKLGANKGFEDGFQKAIEILGDKKFSEDDIRKAILLSMKYNDNAVIKSLQQTEWDVEIVTTTIMENGKCGLDVPIIKPKLDADGCLILKT